MKPLNAFDRLTDLPIVREFAKNFGINTPNMATMSAENRIILAANTRLEEYTVEITTLVALRNHDGELIQAVAFQPHAHGFDLVWDTTDETEWLEMLAEAGITPVEAPLTPAQVEEVAEITSQNAAGVEVELHRMREEFGAPFSWARVEKLNEERPGVFDAMQTEFSGLLEYAQEIGFVVTPTGRLRYETGIRERFSLLERSIVWEGKDGKQVAGEQVELREEQSRQMVLSLHAYILANMPVWLKNIDLTKPELGLPY